MATQHPRSQPDDLFAGTASYYARRRPGYPPAFIAHIVARYGLDGTGRLLDLGCGTGQLALPLAAHVGEVVGLDPDREMLAEAARAAATAGARNISWLVGADRDLEHPPLRERLTSLRLTTIGRAFHWMAQDRTLTALYTLTEPGGGVVITGEPDVVWDGPRHWQQAATAVVRRWLGEARRAGSGTYTPPSERWEATLARGAFVGLETFQLAFTRRWDIDGVRGYLYSTSYCSPRLLGARLPAFERDLRDALLALEPGGVFEQDVELEAHLVWKAAHTSGDASEALPGR